MGPPGALVGWCSRVAGTLEVPRREGRRCEGVRGSRGGPWGIGVRLAPPGHVQVVCCPGRDKGPGMTQTQTKLSKVMPSLSSREGFGGSGCVGGRGSRCGSARHRSSIARPRGDSTAVSLAFRNRARHVPGLIALGGAAHPQCRTAISGTEQAPGPTANTRNRALTKPHTPLRLTHPPTPSDPSDPPRPA